MDDLCEFVSDGGTFSEWCKHHGLIYKHAHAWLTTDLTIQEQYNAAITARESALSDTVLAGVRETATLDPRTLFDKDGNLLPIHEMPDAAARSITGFEVVEEIKNGKPTGGYLTKVKYTPRHQGLELLGKHLGFARERVELTGKDGGPLTTEQIVSNETARRIAFVLAAAQRQVKEQAGG